MFSPDGWSLVGEAGVFTDPFYSPGSDFIAIGNDCAADLIVRTARGEDVRERAEAFNTNYLRLFDAFLRLYSGQYPLMGNAQVMTAKAAWDNGAYWAITGLLYFQRRYTRPEFMQSIDPLMRRFFVLHARMQQLFNAWDLADQSQYEDAFSERRERGLPARAFRRASRRRRWTTRRCGGSSRTTSRCSKRSPQRGRRWRPSAIRRWRASCAATEPLLDLSPLVLQPVAASAPSG